MKELNAEKQMDTKQNILVFNTACFGDVLVCNTLVQNIKLEYPSSKVVFICDKPYVDVAKYQKDVDEVIVYDKKGVNRGIKGLIKFIKEFPYKKPFASFVAYGNKRNLIISHFIRAKYIYENSESCYSMQYRVARLLQKVTHKEVRNLPIKYIMDSNLSEDLKEIFKPDKEYIAFAPVSKNPEKDMPLDTAIEIVKKLSETFNVIYTGAGEKAQNFAMQMKNAGADFTDLTNKTSFPDLARVLQHCSALLSIDTGTMHMAYALGVPTVCVFYRKNTVETWAPDPKIYKNVHIIDDNYTAEHMYQELMELREDLNCGK